MEKGRQWMSRSFLLLWQGHLVSQIGSQVFLVTLVLWLKQATESATVIGLLMMLGTVPGVVLAPLGGVLVDRYSRVAVLVMGDLVKGITILGVALALFLRPDSPGLIVAALCVASFVGGIVGAATQPAGASLLPDLVPKERLVSANSLVQGSFQVCGIIAQALAGLLFRFVGAPVLALFDGLTYLYAAVSEAFIKTPPAAPRPARPAGQFWKGMWAEVMEGLKYIRGQAGMRMLFYTMSFLRFFLVPIAVLLPFYVDEHLLAGPEWYGFLLAASGLGTLVGYVVASTVRLSGSSTSWTILTLMTLISLGLGSLGLILSSWTALLVFAGVGAMSSFVGVKLLTILQLATPAPVRGRVFGLLGTITGALAPIAMALSGVVADLTDRNIPLIFVACGGITALLSLSVTMRRECRAFLAGEAAVMPPLVAVPVEKPA
jgi:MFS transporter, DHA3 family, macrolide efflux protein